MTKQDRTTLKSFFRHGALPAAEQYRDLIDSTVNQVDDGFAKTKADGLKLSSLGSSRSVVSLYQGLGAPRPSWRIEHGAKEGDLHFRPDLGKQALRAASETSADAPNEDQNIGDGSRLKEPELAAGFCLTPEGCLGVNQETPDWRLDIGGMARMGGRIGFATEGLAQPLADGKWHDITRPMTGCQAFEVVAGAGGEKTQGRYSMLHAIVMNAYNPRKRLFRWLFGWLFGWLIGRRGIRAQTAVYGSYADRLSLRWVATEGRHHFKLQICTNANFGKNGSGEPKTIRYYLTRLWFDSEMEGSREGPDRDPGLR